MIQDHCQLSIREIIGTVPKFDEKKIIRWFVDCIMSLLWPLFDDIQVQSLSHFFLSRDRVLCYC